MNRRRRPARRAPQARGTKAVTAGLSVASVLALSATMAAQANADPETGTSDGQPLVTASPSTATVEELAARTLADGAAPVPTTQPGDLSAAPTTAPRVPTATPAPRAASGDGTAASDPRRTSDRSRARATTAPSQPRSTSTRSTTKPRPTTKPRATTAPAPSPSASQDPSDAPAPSPSTTPSHGTTGGSR